MSNQFVTPTLILDEIVRHLQQIASRSRDRSENPAEDDAKSRHRFEHWCAYTGSIYNEAIDSGINFDFIQEREMEFASFVRVINLQRDHRSALDLHQTIMNLLNGFKPTINIEGIAIDGIKSPLTLKSDTLLPPRGEELAFRYQALYKITVAAGFVTIDDGFTLPSKIVTDLWRSPAEDLGNVQTSSLFGKVVVEGDS